jgi:hypothetical protein
MNTLNATSLQRNLQGVHYKDGKQRTRRGARANARRRGAARRRTESATTLLVADLPTALAGGDAEGASCCAARAVPSDNVSCMLAARRVPTDRFADGVPGAGREPSVVCS